jgi:hypothetical protein
LSDNYHILPLNDTEEHERSPFCQCEPKIEKQENGSMLIIHNSFDGREMVEEAKKILDYSKPEITRTSRYKIKAFIKAIKIIFGKK